MTALDRLTGERYTIRAADRYQAVCLLAEGIGIDEHYVVKKNVALAVEAIEKTYFPKKSRSKK